MEIFERVNGGTRLSRQQMRNALYCGEATKWLKETAECEMFFSSNWWFVKQKIYEGP